MPELRVVRLGLVPYAQALELQRAIAHRRITGELDEDVLLLLEHPPVVTLGRTAKARHLVASTDYLRQRGVEVFEVERGGDVTFHGPGQLVGYPILDLKRHRRDLHWYLRQVEEALIRTLAQFGITAWRHGSYTGVWVGAPPASGDARDGSARRSDDGTSSGGQPDLVVGGGPPRKIASIGVHARDWVTWHGFALNVTTDLSYFDLIVPCGIPDVVMTSVSRETGWHVALREVESAVALAFGDVFALAPAELMPDALELPGGAPA
jgi:lipoyl(octanoyl) transferase